MYSVFECQTRGSDTGSRRKMDRYNDWRQDEENEDEDEDEDRQNVVGWLKGYLVCKAGKVLGT